jgi:SAM-dependent methyltransferase
MKPTRRAKPAVQNFSAEGMEAFQAGRFYLAAEAFAKAHVAEPGNPVHQFNLATVKEQIGEMDEAAELLTEALRLRPSWFEPAQRLALLLGRYKLSAPEKLDPRGLMAAFAFDRIGHQPIASAAIAHLRATTPLGEAVTVAAEGKADDAARGIVLRRTDKLLAHPLLLAALSHGININSAVEKLLAAVRRVLLVEASPERFEDKALTAFVLALIRQCLANEYIFPVTAAEEQRLAGLTVDRSALWSGAPDQARRLMLHLLYEPPGSVFSGEAPSSPADCRALRPRALGELLSGWFEENEREARLAAAIPQLSPIEDATSRRVAGQYEAHPYPRWTSMQAPVEDSAGSMLERYFPPAALTFRDRPFKVLIAGAGTGMQAIAAAIRYGPRADVLAVDLSRRSLAYAKAKADLYGVKNIRFAQGDLLNLPVPADGPFDIIEALGVLHHMAEPFKGWQALLQLLRPGGLILTGLYSAVARRNIAELRSEAGYPGPGCDDAVARRYRAGLMDRTDGASTLKQSHDFYTLSDFRDLVLHEHERPVFLSEVEAFLAQNGLTFRGFSLPQLFMEGFHQAYPGDGWPGALGNWAAFEEKHPRIFDSMYQLWCEKAAG